MNVFLLLTIMIITIIIIVIIVISYDCYRTKRNIENFYGGRIFKFMKCIFFTNKQYNVDKIHIPTQSLYIQNDIKINNINDINNYINNMIDHIYNRLNAGNVSGIPAKIPAPLFALIGRKLDYHTSIFDGEKFKTPFRTPFNYGSTTVYPNGNGELAILSYFNSFFNSGLGEMPRDQEKLIGSLASSFKFKKNVRIIIYAPYLTNEYKYVTNFTDIINSSRFFYSLLTNDFFLDFKKTTIITYETLKNKYKNLNERSLRFLLEILTREDRKNFTLYEDLLNLCVEGGCVSDYGEDINRLTTTFTDDMNQNNEEAIKKSPYVPSKCLAQTKGYINNIRDIHNNRDVPEFLNENAMKEIQESLYKYVDISDKIARGDRNIGDDEESKKIADYTSPVDLIISIMNKYIKDGYLINLNDGERNGIKANHYSKDYSKNIIKELSLINKFYPGVPEVIMSFNLIDETQRSDKIIYHPWGRQLLSSRNVLKLGESIPANKSLFSFNNRFVMSITNAGIIYVYDRNSGRLLYFVNRTPVYNAQSVTISTTDISVEYISNDNNKKSQSLKLPNDIKSLVGNCEECMNEPFNLIIDDNNGSLLIYANSFVDATSSEFRNFINSERENAQRLNMNINDANFMNNIGKPIEFGIQEDYVFCSSIDRECKK